MEDLCKNFKVSNKKARVVYNPVNVVKISTMAAEKLGSQHQHIFPKNEKIIVSVGRLTFLKGQGYLLESFALLKKEMPGTRLVLVGDGELKATLQKKSESLGIADSVFFLGEQKNPFKFVAKSDVFVFTSLYEGFPNAVLEALACGTPVVSVDCRSGPREILAPHTDPHRIAREIEQTDVGVLVPPFGYIKDKPQILKREIILKEAIIKVLKSPGLQKKYAHEGIIRARQLESGKSAAEFLEAVKEVLHDSR
jgi:glycosyltransferase involved in cell wall biosynthesis